MPADAQRTTEHVPEWKRREVEDLVEVIRAYDSVGVVDVEGIPSRQLQEMRSDLHGRATLRMSRNTLLARALEEVDEGLEVLTEYLSGHVGLVGTNDNPFGLFRQLEQSKTPAPINAGEVAPNDIVVPEGDTGMDPGPFVGDLQNIGANARIEEGSIRVLEDSVVAEEGEVVTPDVANVLSELGIEPKEVGLDLRAVYSDGVLFEADELELDVDQYRADVQAAVAAGRNLSINAAIPTARTVRDLLVAANADAKSLGLQAAIESPDLTPDLVSTADAQVRALASQIDDEEALPAELRDVEAPEPQSSAETADGSDEGTADQADAQTDDQTEAEEPSDEDTADESDEEDAAGEGLGDMFG
ncbi:MAG: 50S ribosomal protein L10 [Halodesulfurarchaeum sp.]